MATTELRNAVYNHFIDLDPTVGEATALAHSSQQIRAEFGSLCLASGHVAIPTEHVKSFIHVFFPRHLKSRPRITPSTIDLSFDWVKSQDWLTGLQKLVTTMHRYSLLKISWFQDITMIISILESTDSREFETITSVEYYLCYSSTNRPHCFLPGLRAFLEITIKDVSPELYPFRLGLSREYGVINVRVALDGSLDSEEETSESSSGDEDGSDSEEESSDGGDDEEDGDEDAPDSSEGAIENGG
ncbi:hypothetical protein J4E80_006370 [Alternaria sp. BMP 0032]|nr:hypothetical protein J4E80_006370 [Alternaria sp. BMP 0032]